MKQKHSTLNLSNKKVINMNTTSASTENKKEKFLKKEKERLFFFFKTSLEHSHEQLNEAKTYLDFHLSNKEKTLTIFTLKEYNKNLEEVQELVNRIKNQIINDVQKAKAAIPESKETFDHYALID